MQCPCRCNPLQALQMVTPDGHPPKEELLSDVFGQILLKMTIVIITIINIIITIIYYQYEGRYLSTFHACETHLGLSRTWQRMLLLPGRTSFWTSFGKFF